MNWDEYCEDSAMAPSIGSWFLLGLGLLAVVGIVVVVVV